MESLFDVVAIGEILIDFLPSGKGRMGNECFEMNPGGAPANCLAANAALGGKTAFIGTVGDDLFGRFLRQSLSQAGIDHTGLREIQNASTTVDVVLIGEDGERDFAFLRKPGADYMITPQVVDFKIIDTSQLVHFGSLSLTNSPGRETVLDCIRYAKQQGKRITYDPNYREPLWTSRREAVRQMRAGLALCDVAKLSETELEMLSGFPVSQLEDGARAVFEEHQLNELYITSGDRGAYYLTRGGAGFVSGFPVRAVDTTGCGDAFLGAIQYLMVNRPDMPVRERVAFANAVGALCATTYTGFLAMPNLEQVQTFLAQSNKTEDK